MYELKFNTNPLRLAMVCVSLFVVQSSYGQRLSVALSTPYFHTKDGVPVGKHKFDDAATQTRGKIWYTKLGIIKKAVIRRGSEKMKFKFPEYPKDIDWQEIEPGLYINRKENVPVFQSTFDPERTIRFHYDGRTKGDFIFGNSFQKNAAIRGPLSKFIKGFALGVAQMTPGEFRVLKIEPEWGYGPDGGGNVPPESTLIYYVYLLE